MPGQNVSETKRRPGRPSQGGPTTVRSVRVGEVWDAAEAKAERNGETITAVVKRLLAEYVEDE